MNLLKKFIVTMIGLLIFLWESLIYKPSKLVFDYLDRLKLFYYLENFFRELPPVLALLAPVLVVLTLLPFKLFGVWLIGNHHAILGLNVFILAKIIGSFLFVRIFDLTESSMRKIAVVDKSLSKIFEVKNELLNTYKSSRIYAQLHALKESAKKAIKTLFSK